MRFEIVTIFPGFFAGILENGIVRRAQADGLLTVGIHDLRTFTHDRHRTVDDRPFGGGEGMVLKPEPLAEALESLGVKPKAERVAAFPALVPGVTRKVGADNSGDGTRVILLSAQGRRLTQAVVRELVQM